MNNKLACILLSAFCIFLVDKIGEFFGFKTMSDEFNLMLVCLCTWVAYEQKK